MDWGNTFPNKQREKIMNTKNMRNSKITYENSVVSEQEMFDALTIYYKNDCHIRHHGVQLGKTDGYLISHGYSNLIIYKIDKDYDLSRLEYDYLDYLDSGRGTQWTGVLDFAIGSINTVAKRKWCTRWTRLMPSHIKNAKRLQMM